MTEKSIQTLIGNRSHNDLRLFDEIVIPVSSKEDGGLYDPTRDGEGGNLGLRNASHCDLGIRGNYVNVGRFFWNDKTIAALQTRFDKLNSQTSEFTFHLLECDNYDEELGERIWEANFSFYLERK